MLKIGVFGAGHLGKIHIQQWQQIEDTQLIGFFDPDDIQAEAIVAKHNLQRFFTMDSLIDSPYPIPLREVINEKPRRVLYRTDHIRYKHYGNNIELMVMTVAKMEESAEKQAYIEMIANLMKKFYLTWNKEAVNDDQIFKDLSTISKGAINIGPEMKLSETRDILFKNKKKNKITKKKF